MAIQAGEPSVYYDPYDFEIDADPYPIWQRLRDERPLYYNEKYDFYALSRFADVERCSKDWRRYSSAQGTVLDFIRSGMRPPAGALIMQDPPLHDRLRALVTGIFSPRKMAALEPKIRAFCARSLDAQRDSAGFDFIADLGAQMPMRTIGMLLGIPEEDQEAIRDLIDGGLKLRHGEPTPADKYRQLIARRSQVFAEYLERRARQPTDDIMSELLHAELDAGDGVRRRLTREEVLGFVNLLAAAGNETTTRLIGWAGKVLAEHPEQLQQLVADRSLIPRAVEELLRFESPSPVQARCVTEAVEHHGQTVPEGSIMLLLTASANRDERRIANPERFDIHRTAGQHIAFGYGVHFCLGAALARLEARVALEEVLERFPEWEVDWEHAVRAHTSTVRGWERMPVKTRAAA